MKAPRSGIGVEDLVVRERTLTNRLETLRMLANITGTTGVVAFVIAILAYRDLPTTLVAATPLVVTVVAKGWGSVTRFQLRKVRLLLAVLDVGPKRAARRDRGAVAVVRRQDAPRQARGRALTLNSAQNGREETGTLNT